MAIVINGSGTVTGISVGGLPDGIVDAGTLATNSVDSAELIDGAVDAAHLASGVIGVQLAGSASGDGSTGSGSVVDMLTTSSFDLSNYEGKHLLVSGQTAISEDANTANTSILRIQLNNGSSTTTLATSRQGDTTSGTFDTNQIGHISSFAIYQIASAYATTCTLRLNGGVDAGAFTYGNQGGNSNFDGEGAGISLSYFVI